MNIKKEKKVEPWTIEEIKSNINRLIIVLDDNYDYHRWFSKQCLDYYLELKKPS